MPPHPLDEAAMTRRGFMRCTAALSLAASLVPRTAAGETGEKRAIPPRFYAWTAARRPELIDVVGTGQKDSAAALVRQAQAAWQDVPLEHRCIFIAPMANLQKPPFRGVSLHDLILHGPDLSFSRRWWSDILWGLQRHGLPLSRVALDWEAGVGYWHLKGTGDPDQSHHFQPIWSDPDALARLPEDLRRFEPSDFNWQKNRDAVNAWDEFAQRFRAQALRDAFALPLWDVFPEARITNYRDMAYAGELRDRNGWPVPRGGITEVSSPPLYRKIAEENLQKVRAIVAGGHGPPVPWVSYPSYIGPDVWEATIRGCHQLGVREYLYWNPNVKGKAPDDDAFAASVAAELQRG